MTEIKSRVAALPLACFAAGMSLVVWGCNPQSAPPGEEASGEAPPPQEAGAESSMAGPACAEDNAGLTLPAGFCATVFADNLGQARHMAVAGDGTVYLNTWASSFKPRSAVPAAGFLVALKDGDGDGVAETIERFGEDGGNTELVGGTGLAIHDGHLYAEATGTIVRYPLVAGELVPQGAPEVIVSGLPLGAGHTMKSFAIAPDGALYVNSGSLTNSCQVVDRTLQSPGDDPCAELETHAGIWRYDAGATGQVFSPAERYATGIRNTVAPAIHPSGALYVVQHGRDQLHESWPELFTADQGSNLPAEVMYKVESGGDYGWPYCYFDGAAGVYRLAPEYGGDGTKTDRCENVPMPVAVFGAHWAPNALLFYTAAAFPEHYRGGAFIAFHGSWNRVAQQGYNVVFQPLDGAGGASGEFEVFADGFAGATKTPDGAAHRPSGLAVGPDGALYVSDDAGGRIYRIVAR